MLVFSSLRAWFRSRAPASFRRGLALLMLGSAVGCAAVFPELATPMRDAPPGFQFDPPPPDELVYVAFRRAVIPNRTRDGRPWRPGSGLPDPFAKLIVDGKDLIVTPVEGDTLTPSWPNQKRGNHRIRRNATVKVELWDSNAIQNYPICSKTVRDFHEQIAPEGRREITCDGGALVELTLEPAHGKLGFGLYYEIRTSRVFVTRVLSESPAARAGVRGGSEIVRIMGQSARGMEEGRVRSLMNSNDVGLELDLLGPDKAEQRVHLKSGPIYPGLNDRI